MKIILIIAGIIVLSFAVFQLFAMSGQSDIETYPYTVEKEYDDFEIRSYEAALFTSIKMSSSEYKQTSSKGFRILAGYIFGGNETNEKIAMTSPVSMSLDDSVTMMFMVPKQYDKTTLPKPNEGQIEFREEPAKMMAAITFGGWANDSRIEEYKIKLIEALKAEGIEFTDKFYFFGYNPPYDVVNRRNEIIVELNKNEFRN